MLLNDLINNSSQYFLNLGFEEVVTPLLNPSLPLEQNIYSFEVTSPGSKIKLYRPTSPEFALKKHLAVHKKNCFSVSPCFRNLESTGPHHRPQFTMIEWYEVGKNYQDIMTSVKNYLNNFIKLDFKEFKLKNNLPTNEPDFNQYFLNEIEPNLPNGGVLVTGYPSFLTPLAVPNERFELYINRIEVANGNTESRDASFILAAMKQEESHRLTQNLPTHPLDIGFIKAIGQLPPCAGVGLGLDRLAMTLNNSTTLG